MEIPDVSVYGGTHGDDVGDVPEGPAGAIHQMGGTLALQGSEAVNDKCSPQSPASRMLTTWS